jgi:hypothetical protein
MINDIKHNDVVEKPTKKKKVETEIVEESYCYLDACHNIQKVYVKKEVPKKPIGPNIRMRRG